MGATNIDFELPYKATTKDIERAFKEQQREDRDYNGHRDGYSGDFQTVDKVLILDKEFTDYREAYDYCLEHAQKWDYVVAVRVNSPTHKCWLIAGWGAC